MQTHILLTEKALWQHQHLNRTTLVQLALLYLFVIVYGSLIPFQWNNLAFTTALEKFQQIPLLKLGTHNRADLVANLLLYIPFGFLICGCLAQQRDRPVIILIRIVLSLLFIAVVIVSIEFTQQFFPPRTVSLNDIFAEFGGSVIGIGLWLIAGPWCVSHVQAISRGGIKARQTVLIFYTLIYLGLSLFPYDFLLSADEWQTKLASESLGWLFVPHCGITCIGRLIPEILIVIPIALLIFGSKQHPSFFLAAMAGAVLGILIEVLQLTIVSGITQGASIASRIIGMLLGVKLIQSARNQDWRNLRQKTRSLLMLGIIPYLAALTWASGWFSGDWLNLSEGWLRLTQTHFLPFYYHYYSTETVALISLLFQIGLYLPVGIGCWLWHWSESADKWQHGPIWSAVIAATLACLAETGKLFVSGLHPDPTDIWIAAAAAATAYHLLNFMFPPTTSIPITSRLMHQELASVTQPITGIKILGILALCIATTAALSSPLSTIWIPVALAIYAALLWWRSDWWLVWVLALLPLLDLTPWSGRLFWTTYDTLLLVTIGIGYLRLHPDRYIQPAFNRLSALLLSLFTLSAVISLGISILPLTAPDSNAFSQYHSPYNAFRVAKGLFFALAFIPLLVKEWNKPEQVTQKLALGMTLGLLGVVLYVLWERATFSGLFNFTTHYRITGPFSGMHVGGAYIETYLAATLPFVALWAWQQRRMHTSIAAACLFSLGTYSIMVTFSRTGQAAFILTTVIVIFGFIKLILQTHMRRFINIGTTISLICIIVAVAWPIFGGQYSQSRWATIEQDIIKRTNHWAKVLDILRLQDTSVFGAGLGSFPAAYFWSSDSPTRPATYTFSSENNNQFLRLGSGDALYFEQSVAVLPEQRYQLTLDLRANAENATLTIFICEKSLLYSYTCIPVSLHLKSSAGHWARYETQIYTRNFGPPGSQMRRPVKLSLRNGNVDTIVDIDNIALRDLTGKNLISNGDFSEAMHHWFFSVDNYWPWHIENFYLSIFFEQGWPGLICLFTLIIYALTRWSSCAWHNDKLSLVLFASFIAFLVIGLLNSWNDEPRLSFLFYFLLIIGLMAEVRFIPAQHHSSTISNRL